MQRQKVTLSGPLAFDWDEWNLNKNRRKHNVEWSECEEAFFNKPLIMSGDDSHSTHAEKRFRALGKTRNGRFLFIVFTLRDEKVRIISARDQNKKERVIYKGGGRI